MTTPADHIRAAITQATAGSDPTTRAQAVTRLLDDMARAIIELRQTRQTDVLHLRQTLKLREIGALLDISPARVDQIAKGR